MKKIDRETFNSLTKEQQEMVTSLGLEVSENHRGEKQSRRSTDSALERYACIVSTECKLCHTVHTKVFSMEGIGGLLTSTETSIDSVDGMTVKTRSEITLTCSSCRDVLKCMCQEDLIALTLRIAKGEKITHGR